MTFWVKYDLYHRVMKITFWLHGMWIVYTLIPQKEGIDAANQLFKDSELYSEAEINLFAKLFDLNLSNNFFLFQDSFFLQLRGVAMGSNVVPPFACALMHYFKRRYIYANKLFCKHCVTWWRYIDDVFAVWRGNIGTLRLFNKMLNHYSSDI